ncbi:hypothetical protein D1Z90_14540 [Motilimonas pumila]|uniref:Uncharacterized protein n=1 Tax=Motilimonas pumila TaxID=2303987 RepID=A0A418YCB0_9GAMM|nr:hypothetical protein D1Z90_14540 [Motilimonas pumila]
MEAYCHQTARLLSEVANGLVRFSSDSLVGDCKVRSVFELVLRNAQTYEGQLKTNQAIRFDALQSLPGPIDTIYYH